jgi:serine/threonine protein kinase
MESWMSIGAAKFSGISCNIKCFMHYLNGRSVLDALRFLHQKHVVHRDLKPDNILTDPKGNVKVCEILCFVCVII